MEAIDPFFFMAFIRKMMVRIFIAGIIICPFLFPVTSPSEEKETDKKKIVFEYELDPYYSALDLYVSLTEKPIPDMGERSELEIYRDLLKRSYIPRFLVLEASVNPLPVLGVYIRNHANELYKSSEVLDVNLVEAVTAGFEEPWALSLFLGDVVNYTKKGEKKKSGNKGFMGYLVSVGNWHIKDNILIRDDWFELEWKIKGDRELKTKKLNWSFRVGEKFHSNDDITDILYLSLRRSRLDLEETTSRLKNSGFEYTF